MSARHEVAWVRGHRGAEAVGRVDFDASELRDLAYRYGVRDGAFEDLMGLADEVDRANGVEPERLPLHRTAATFGLVCSTCDGGGCPDCTDPA